MSVLEERRETILCKCRAPDELFKSLPNTSHLPFTVQYGPWQAHAAIASDEELSDIEQKLHTLLRTLQNTDAEDGKPILSLERYKSFLEKCS